MRTTLTPCVAAVNPLTCDVAPIVINGCKTPWHNPPVEAPTHVPPAPQEWYKEHDGPSSSVDDFAIAITNQIQIDGIC